MTSPKQNEMQELEKEALEPAGPEEPLLYCPVCSVRLAARSCKLVCEKCGYYLSCSDYY